MTALMTEPVSTGTDEDDLIHTICWCLPRNMDGDLLALCGTVCEDEPDGTEGSGMECIICADLETMDGACRSCRR